MNTTAQQKPKHDRQWIGVFVKNWMLFRHTYGGFVTVLALTLLLLGGTIYVHNYYVSLGNPADDDPDNDSNIVTGNWIVNPYPSLTPSTIFNIFYLGSPDVGKVTYENSTNTNGYVNVMDIPFADPSQGIALRTPYTSEIYVRRNYSGKIYDDFSADPLLLTPTIPYYVHFKELYEDYVYMWFTGINITYYPTPQEIKSDTTSEEDKLLYHAKTVSEMYKYAVPNVSNQDHTYNSAFEGMKVNEVPTFGLRFSPHFNKLPIRIAREADGDMLVVDYAYDFYTYSKTKAYYINQTDHTRILELQGLQFQLCIRNMIKQVYQATTTGDTVVPEAGPQIVGRNAGFWRRSTGDSLGPDGITPIILSLFIPLLMFIISPPIIFALVADKTSGMVHLHSMMGQRYLARWAANLIYHFILSTCVAALIIIMSFLGELGGIRYNTFVAWLPMFIIFAMNVAIFSAFISAFFDNERVASLTAIIIAFSYAIGGFICTAAFSSSTTIDKSISPWFALIPFFGPISINSQLQSLAILQTNSLYLHVTDLRFYVHNTTLSRAYVGRSVSISLILSTISTFAMTIIAMYVDLVMPKKVGLSNHWLFFLLPLVNRVDKLRGRRTRHITTGTICNSLGWAMTHPIRFCSRSKSYHFMLLESTDFKPKISDNDTPLDDPASGTNNSLHNSFLLGQSQPIGTINFEQKNDMALDHLKSVSSVRNMMTPRDEDTNADLDVVAERARARMSYTGFNGKPILIRAIDLTKTYPATRTSPEKQAVRGVSFAVAEGECLGLLGPNGAAKTTTINILTMLHRATTGEAYVLDKNLLDPYNRSYIQTVAGICPQFDTLYPTLTCRQHLKYFCCLKGVAKAETKEHIDSILDSVGLTEKADSAVKSLSGGQRRRLSVAIALTGSPSILYLDEPSTGLDPFSKRLLWDVILKIRSSRAILLTTHSMDEAQALCNRIAIMDRGLLRCIGKCTHLQGKYGGSVQITLEVFQSKAATEHAVINGIQITHELEQTGHRLIEETFGDSIKLRSVMTGILTYDVSDKLTTPKVFTEMVKLAFSNRKIIADWSLLQASLDRVFFNVILG